MPWLKDNWHGGERTSAKWCNALARWFNRLTFQGPLGEIRNATSWALVHRQPDDLDPADDACVVIGPLVEAVVGEGAEEPDYTSQSVGALTDSPLRLYAMTRVAYYHAGNKTLYGYVRALTFDRWGHLTNLGPETRVAVDVPEEC